MKNIWEILGIEPTKEIALIKRAFSERSKEVHPEEHPEEFMELRRAYRAACDYVATGKEEFFISAKEIELSKKPMIEEEERVNIFTTLKLMSQEESFLAENKEDSIFVEVEKLLEEMQKEIEALIIEFKRIMINSPRSKRAFKKIFASEQYRRFCEKEELVEFFTDILVTYTRSAKYSNILMDEIQRLKYEYRNNFYINRNIMFVEYVQKDLPKNRGIPTYKYSYFSSITIFLLLYLFAGPIRRFVLYFCLVFYVPIGLFILVVKYLVKD
jgi:DnaJ-class molecular chaperone with C-terminal Zn finger domain